MSAFTPASEVLLRHSDDFDAGIEPTWTVASLSELEQLLCKH